MSRVLIGLTGSIACFKVAGLISELVKSGHQVKTVATKSALQFIGKSTLEGLSGNPVYTELFADGDNMEHIHLGRWADLFLIAPCTANTMSKIKVGLADDLLTSIALAFEKNKPVYIAPAMNKEMWSNAATQESYRSLMDRGYRFIGPESGDLACGEIGSGRMAEPETILECLFRPKNKKVLITGGGTREPIDGVRFIGNSSTGKTSQTIADALRLKGYDVNLLMAQDSFSDFNSLEEKLKFELENHQYDAVIHAAAVSDYSVDKLITDKYEGPSTQSSKLATGQSLTIHLKPNPKLLDHLKEWSLNKDIQVVGFKLTQTKEETERVAAVQKLFKTGQVDYVVHNDLNEMSPNSHIFRVLANDRLISQVHGPEDLAVQLDALLEGGAI